MSSRLLTLFSDTGDPQSLAKSAESFIDQNSSHLAQFKILIYLYRPTHQTVEMFKEKFLHRTPYIMAGSTPPCIPCVMSRHKVRYGVLIPGGWMSIGPLWPYLDEVRHTLSNIQNLYYIRFSPDTDLINRSTNEPLVYNYYTSNILIGNGNHTLPKSSPVLAKAKPPASRPIVTGGLRRLVFREVE